MSIKFVELLTFSTIMYSSTISQDMSINHSCYSCLALGEKKRLGVSDGICYKAVKHNLKVLHSLTPVYDFVRLYMLV